MLCSSLPTSCHFLLMPSIIRKHLFFLLLLFSQLCLLSSATLITHPWKFFPCLSVLFFNALNSIKMGFGVKSIPVFLSNWLFNWVACQRRSREEGQFNYNFSKALMHAVEPLFWPVQTAAEEWFSEKSWTNH